MQNVFVIARMMNDLHGANQKAVFLAALLLHNLVIYTFELADALRDDVRSVDIIYGTILNRIYSWRKEHSLILWSTWSIG